MAEDFEVVVAEFRSLPRPLFGVTDENGEYVTTVGLPAEIRNENLLNTRLELLR
jgi:hypothetical protein